MQESQDRDHPSGASHAPHVTKPDAPFSLVARARSFAYAGRGIVAMVATQHNAWIHAVATTAVVTLGALVGVSRYDWALLLLAISIVWVAEAMNTAIEALADALVPQQHVLIERAKDVAAGGVLIAAVVAAIVGFLILGPPLMAALGFG